MDGIVECPDRFACGGQADIFGVDEERQCEFGAAVIDAAGSSGYFLEVGKRCECIAVPQVLTDHIAQLNGKASLHLFGELQVPCLAVWNDRAFTHATQHLASVL